MNKVLLHVESSLFLKTCKDGALTTSEGSEFQLSTTMKVVVVVCECGGNANTDFCNI